MTLLEKWTLLLFIIFFVIRIRVLIKAHDTMLLEYEGREDQSPWRRYADLWPFLCATFNLCKWKTEHFYPEVRNINGHKDF